jgi:hemoglobin-like flavoprotein
LVVPIGETAADLFYKRLFELRPEYKKLFGDDLKSQKRKLIAMLAFIVKSLDWPESAWRDTVNEEDDLCLVMLALGRRHSDLYRIPDESYAVVGEALLWTLDYALGKKFDAPTRGAWARVYGLVSLTMKMGRLSVAANKDSDKAISRIVAVANGSAAEETR